jgi:hypothetical protein
VAGSAGGFGTVATQISVSTNDSNGSELTVAASGASADLSNGAGGSITAAGGTLTANKWGYTFVTGATNTAPTIGSSFSQMPASGSPATLFTDNNAAGTQEGFINYGAVVDYTLVAGANYETTVDFSAAIKP